ncbi:unnamed protein product [Rotaria sp. Silwood2]|nr:unnamed protein product [Rotaria sp. Silwood2]CAF2623962.1 unnamed protein product [Rotaria sp. Silwood2]CAF3015623.1 unnamed protein product [Rotaria sp. Silwood2]CAF4056840.1 unnamed protein product [Rotaria sp. Silwood2]CAF4096756.1 unnamed protein product [Rotaria sp. Silwood2]
MSSSIKRVFKDTTNEKKRVKNDSAIDLNFDIEELKHEKSQSSYSTSMLSESLIDNDSVLDDDVFENEQNVIVSSSKISQNRSRQRLNGTSTYPPKENKNKRKSKHIKKETIMIDQTLNKLREEQARIDAHSLSIVAK